MSVWSQLEVASQKDRELLNRAVDLLVSASLGSPADSPLNKKIKDLEDEVVAHRKNDHRFVWASVVVDARTLNPENKDVPR